MSISGCSGAGQEFADGSPSGQVKGWKVHQIVFVGGTCGSIHVESFNRNMKALGVLESKWDPIRKKLVRRLLEEQDKVLWSYSAHKGGGQGEWQGPGTCPSGTRMSRTLLLLDILGLFPSILGLF